MLFSNVIVDVTVPRRSSVFSQSSVQISAGLTDICGLAVAAFDLINCSLSVPRLVSTGENLSLFHCVREDKKLNRVKLPCTSGSNPFLKNLFLE